MVHFRSMVQSMELILDGNSKHVVGKRDLPKEKIRFVTTLDLNKCLKKIKKPRILKKSLPISELPSNISTAIENRLQMTHSNCCLVGRVSRLSFKLDKGYYIEMEP